MASEPCQPQCREDVSQLNAEAWEELAERDSEEESVLAFTQELLSKPARRTAVMSVVDLGLDLAQGIRDANLPAFEAAVILLEFFLGLTHREISEVLECSERTVRRIRQRALDRIRETRRLDGYQND